MKLGEKLAVLGLVACTAVLIGPGCGVESGGEIETDAGTQNDGSNGTDQNNQECQDDCQGGQQFCDGPGYRTCGNYDSDACLEWSPRIDCPSGACENGQCTGGCGDQCAALTRQCVGAAAYQTCADHNQDGCLEWGGQTSCDGDLICDEGYCVAACSDECSTGAVQCTALADGTESCADHDGDTCLEFGGFVPCGENEVCENGDCVLACSDECNFGEQRCVPGVPAIETCADHDADGCNEFGGQTNCASDQLCDMETGQCYDPSAYPPGPYGTGLGDTIANECFERCLCSGPDLTGSEEFCFEEFLGHKAILIPVSTGW